MYYQVFCDEAPTYDARFETERAAVLYCTVLSKMYSFALLWTHHDGTTDTLHRYTRNWSKLY